ncbi:hypothetical protein F4778DRAFT_2327 [Xylariomycetidae sp. FL2044]|nr:hypothetical protein F4778DRAFT_2327 [Xylariomycetidae sp. FL2044]
MLSTSSDLMLVAVFTYLYFELSHQFHQSHFFLFPCQSWWCCVIPLHMDNSDPNIPMSRRLFEFSPRLRKSCWRGDFRIVSFRKLKLRLGGFHFAESKAPAVGNENVLRSASGGFRPAPGIAWEQAYTNPGVTLHLSRLAQWTSSYGKGCLPLHQLCTPFFRPFSFTGHSYGLK